MTERRAIAVAVLVLAVGLAGCMDAIPGTGDDGDGDGTTDGRSPYADCGYGYNYTLPPSSGVYRSKPYREYEICWWNGNLTDNETETFYYFVGRGQGQGRVRFLAEDGANRTFFDHEFGPGGGDHICDDSGIEATPGNWSLTIQAWNFTGKLATWMIMHPQELNCP